MATDEELFREHILNETIQNVPKSFFSEVDDRFRRAYVEEYAKQTENLTTLSEHKIFKLNQNRCFRLDWELCEAAKRHNLNASAKTIFQNGWYHAYVTCRNFGITQSYVPRLGELPHPAKFREGLAAAANCPRLPIDDPSEIYELKQFYALFAHTPVGRRFTENEQKLGSLMFSVPDRDMKSWALSISLAELISYYPAEKPVKKGERTLPTWKQDKGKGAKLK